MLYYKLGDNIKINSIFIDKFGDGITNASGIISIRRLSDNNFFNGSGWQVSVIVHPMTEIDETNVVGFWKFDFDTNELSTNDELVFFVNDENENALNIPQTSDAIVGGLADLFEDVEAVSGLVENVISNQTIMSGNIDEIELATDTLESGQTTLINATDTLESGQATLINATDTLESGQATLINATDTLESGQATLISATDTLEAGQAIISGFVDQLEGFTDTLESGQNSIIGLVDSLESDFSIVVDAVTSISGLTFGDGSVIVDHDFGGTDNFRVIGSNTVPLDNAVLTAFLKSDYDANLRTPQFIKAQSFTKVDGRWIGPMHLDPETYTIVVSKQGIAISEVFDIIVT